MAYVWQLIDNAFFVRWKKLSIVDLDKIANDVQNARKAQGKPIIYVSITPADLPVPSAAERQALTDFATVAHPHCEQVHVVILGDSVKHSIQRTAITTLQWFMQQRSAQMVIHKQIEPVVRAVGLRIGRKPEDLQKLLESRGLLDETVKPA